MDRNILVDEIRLYYILLAERGIDFKGHSPEELNKMNTNLLIQHRNSVSQLARTPLT